MPLHLGACSAGSTQQTPAAGMAPASLAPLLWLQPVQAATQLVWKANITLLIMCVCAICAKCEPQMVYPAQLEG